jgi:hypothetical protein
MDFTLPNEQEVLARIEELHKHEESLETVIENGKAIEQTLDDVKREFIPTVNNRVQRILHDLYRGKELMIRYYDEREEIRPKEKIQGVRDMAFNEAVRQYSRRRSQHGDADVRSTKNGVCVTIYRHANRNKTRGPDSFFCPFTGRIEYKDGAGPNNFRGIGNPTGMFSRYRPITMDDGEYVLNGFAELPTILMEAYAQYLASMEKLEREEMERKKKNTDDLAKKIDELA